MSESRNSARSRYLRRESVAAIARTLGEEEATVRRWVAEGDWDALRSAVEVEVAALRASEAEAADERYAAVSDAIRGMASALVAKAKTGGTAKGAELLALTRTIREALELRVAAERRQADRRRRMG